MEKRNKDIVRQITGIIIGIIMFPIILLMWFDEDSNIGYFGFLKQLFTK